MLTPDSVAEAERYLQDADPILGAVIASQTLVLPTHREDYFASLCRSIIGQQVSVAAAAAIAKRFEEQTNMKPERAAHLDEETVKIIGLSKQKTSYIVDLAQHFVDNPNIYNHLENLEDEEVIADLIQIKGIGRWTAQMFLMFTLARPDIFAPDDVGLQKGMVQLYKWDTLPPKKELDTIAQKWAPYRTVASLHLWQSLENTPV